ncbi:unnamed protein product, partial [Medioppia subpectinata]
NNLDILFNNCSSLKHLDMIASGGFNARNVINRSQYLTVPVNERLIHFVDTTSAAVSHCQIAVCNSFINSSVCVEVMSATELMVGLVSGTKYAPLIKSHLSAVLATELACVETRSDYLRNTILSMFRILSDRKCENLNNVNIIIAHMIADTSAGTVVVKLATAGQWTSLRQVPLSDRHRNNSTNNNNNNNSNNSLSPKIINLCSKQCSKGSMAGKGRDNGKGLVGDPICHELTLSGDNIGGQTTALLMGINIGGDDDEEDASTTTNELFASKELSSLTDKLKRFTEVVNARNNYLNNCEDCDNHCFGANFLALAIHPKLIKDNSTCEEESSLKSSSSNTSDTNDSTQDSAHDSINDSTIDSEHSEKYRSWEYILEENHKCLFNKELEALKDVDTNRFDSISSRKLKSNNTPIISLQQFITRTEKYKKYDSNTFKTIADTLFCRESGAHPSTRFVELPVGLSLNSTITSTPVGLSLWRTPNTTGLKVMALSQNSQHPWPPICAHLCPNGQSDYPSTLPPLQDLLDYPLGLPTPQSDYRCVDSQHLWPQIGAQFYPNDCGDLNREDPRLTHVSLQMDVQLITSLSAPVVTVWEPMRRLVTRRPTHDTSSRTWSPNRWITLDADHRNGYILGPIQTVPIRRLASDQTMVDSLPLNTSEDTTGLYCHRLQDKSLLATKQMVRPESHSSDDSFGTEQNVPNRG